jgi:multidrug efflux pump subunit AcrA (membrane-fusion protein)
LYPQRSLSAGDEHGHDHAEEGEHSDEIVMQPDAMTPYGITLATAIRAPLSEVATVPARVDYNAEAMAHIGTPIHGRATEILVRLGDVVRAGDLLVVVESPELGAAESDFLLQISMREVAASAVELAREAFQRADELRKTNSVSVSEFLARQSELKAAEGKPQGCRRISHRGGRTGCKCWA